MDNDKKRSAGFEAAQRLINEMVKNRTAGTNYDRSTSTTTQSTTTYKSPEDYVNERLEKLGLNKSRVDEDFVNQFFKDAKSYLETAQSSYNAMDYGKRDITYNIRNRKTDDLRARSWDIRQYLEKNKSAFSEEDYAEYMSFLDEFDKSSMTIDHSFYRKSKYLSSFKDEDDYNFVESRDTAEKRLQLYEDNSKKIADLEAEKEAMGFVFPWLDSDWKRKTEIDDEIERLQAENNNYERGNVNENGRFYGRKVVDDNYSVTQRDDFAITSANRDYANPTKEDFAQYDAYNDSSSWYFDANGVYRDAYGNALEVDESGNWVNPKAKDFKVEDKLGLFLNASDDELVEATGTSIDSEGSWTSIIKDGLDGSWKYLDETEKGIYYTYLGESQEKAYQYLADMKTELNRRQTLDELGQWDKAYDEANLLEKIAMNAATVPAKFVSSIAGTIDNAANTMMGNDINPYSAAQSGMHFSQSVRGNTAEELDNVKFNAFGKEFSVKLPGIDFTLGDVYQTGMSRLDSLAATKVFGGGGTIFLGMGAAQEEAYRLYQQGASADQITVGAFAAGAAEVIWEYLSYGKLKEIKDVDTKFKWVKSILIQGWNEANEEALTEVSNIITNAIVMGSQSDLAELYKENKESAFWTFVDLLQQTAQSAFGGFLGGVGAGAIQSTGVYVDTTSRYRDAGRTIMSAEGGVQGLQDIAYDVANKLDGKLQKSLTKQAGGVSSEVATGKGIGKIGAAIKNYNNATKTGRLYNTVQTANKVANTSANQADIAKSLQRNGFNAETANDLASALVAQYNGQELTKAQQKLLKSVEDSKYVKKAISDILENVKSTVGQRQQNIRDFNADIEAGVISKTYGISKEVAKKMREAIANGKPLDTGKSLSNAETVYDGDFKVSAEGKAAIDGKEVKLDGIQETDSGVMVATADGQTADSGDVIFPSKGHALVYEGYLGLEETALNPVIKGMSVATRSALAKAYDLDPSTNGKLYFEGANQAFWYGFEGMSIDESTLPGNSPIRALSEKQIKIAYEEGRKAGKKATNTQDKAIKAAHEAAVEKLGGKKAASNAAKKNGGAVVLEEGVQESDMTNKERASKNLADKVAQAIGKNVHVYRGMQEYGKYDPSTGEIWLNINGNISGSSMMAFALGHELVHMAKQWAPSDFKAFADYLVKQYGKKGYSVEALVKLQMDNAIDNGYELDEHEAYEEVIADACQRMLLDSDALQKMAGYREQNPDKWQKIVDAIRKFIDNVRKVFKGAEPDSLESDLFKQFDEAVKKELETKFVAMVMNASKHMTTIQNAFGKDTVVAVNADGEFTLAKGEVGGATKFLYNDSTWERGGRDTLKAALKAEGFSSDDIDAALTIMDGKHKLVKELAKKFPEQARINKATITTDLKDGHSVLSALVSNGDYPVNIDLLMVCKKRKAYQRVINRLCETGLIQQATVDALAIAEINKILGKYGFETACLGCFVESRRLRIQEWAETIVKEWNSEVKKRNPNATAFGFGKGKATLTQDEVMQLVGELEGHEKNDKGNLNLGQGSAVKRMGVLLDKVPSLRKTLTVEDLITPDGLTALRKYDSNLFSMVKSRYGSNSPKFVQEFNPYNHELAEYGKVPTEYNSLREYLYAIGGARMQSFSDFIVENWFDYCQIVADLAARKLPMHTYTKEITLAKLFGLTGIKINMSLIPDIDRSLGKEYAGLTRNAKGELELIWADKDRFKKTGGKSYMQSINFADAIALQNDPRYSGNVGTIAVGVSDNHILMMLDDARIRMIIPYHSSGMNPIFADLMGTSFYKDYTMFQNTTVKQLYNSKGQKVSLKLDKTQTAKLTSGFQFNEVLQELGDARAAAEAYKDWCADASKHTITIKGETYTAELTPKFDDFSSHENYYKLLEDFNTYDCISEEAAPQGDVQQIYPDNFDDILKGELKAQEKHRQKQVADQAFDKAMGEIEDYLSTHTKADTVFYAEQHGIKLNAKDKKLNAADKAKLADLRKGMKMSMPKVRDAEYMDAVKRGDMETVQRLADEAAKKAGFDSTVYHGTPRFGFTKIKTEGVEDGTEWSPFFATDSLEVAETYSGKSNVRGVSDNTQDDTDAISEAFRDRAYDLCDYINRAAGHQSYISYDAFDSVWEDAANGTLSLDVIRDSFYEDVESIVQELFAYSEYHDQVNDPDVDQDELYEQFVESDEIDRIYSAANDIDFILRGARAANSGNYQFYANTGNLFEIDAKGNSWSRIPFDEYDKNGFHPYVNTRQAAVYAKQNGFDGVKVSNVYDDGGRSIKKQRNPATVYIFFSPQKQVKSADPVTYDDDGNVIPLSQRFNQANNDIRYSMPKVKAPTFYSHMARVVDGVKQEKLGAASIVSMLRGKGVKAEEIKWSGIEEWLQGKKSVTKAELQEFIAGSMLQIEEEELSETVKYTDEEKSWLDDLERDVESYFDKIADKWPELFGEEMPLDVMMNDDLITTIRLKLARSNLLDTADGKRMVTWAERIVSSSALIDTIAQDARKRVRTAKWQEYSMPGGENYREIVFTMPGSNYTNRAMKVHWGSDTTGVIAHARIQDMDTFIGHMLFIEEIQSDWHNEGHAKGYESAEYKEAERISDELFEKWRKIRQAMNKYARSSEFTSDPEDVRKKKWDWYRMKEEEAYKKRQEADARLESLMREGSGTVPDAPFRENYHEYVLKRLIRMAAEQGYDSIGWTTSDIQMDRWNKSRKTNAQMGIESKNPNAVAFEEGYRIEYDQDIPKFLNKYGKKWGTTVGKTVLDSGTEVWSMAITDSMKESVLYDGQPKYSMPKVSGRAARIADTQAKVTAKYKRAVDKVLAGTYNSKDNIMIGYTPEIFTKLGMPSLPFVIGPGHVYTATVTEAEAMADPLGRYKRGDHYHGLGVNAVKNLYSAIQDPIMIIASKDTDDKKRAPRSLHSVVAIVDVGNASKHLLLPVEITAPRIVGGRRIDVNVLSSAYERPVENLVSEAIAQMNTGDVGVYYAKKEATALLSGRVSFPKQLTAAIASDGIVHHFSEKVNMAISNVTQSLQFTDWFGDWQNDPQHSSKVVNDDGTPMVVYHGAKSGNIKTFRTTNENGTGGLFLSTSRSVAAGFAGASGEVYESYVNLRNPFIVDAKVAFYDSIDIPPEMKGSKYAFGNTVDTNSIAAYARAAGYDGVIIRNVREPSGFGDDIIAFAPEQVKSVDNIGTFDKTKRNSMYKTPNSRGMSPRQLLADAFDELVQTPKEREKMDEYRNNIAKVDEVQERLKKLRGKISELTKSNGDKAKIKQMSKTAAELADLIDRYDRKLLELEASKPLRDVLARARSAAYQEARERSEKSLKEYRQQVSERFDRGVENRRKTEMRKKIRKTIRDLDKILNRGDKKRNVKEDMKDFVAEALSAAEVLFTDNYTNEDIIRNGFGVELSKEEAKYLEEARGFMDELSSLPTGGYDAWQERQEAEEKLKSKLAYRMSKLKDAFFRERQRLNKAEVAEVLGNLADAYAKLETSEYAYVNGAYHEAVYQYLKMLQDEMGGAKVNDMTLGQLENLHKAYTMVLTTVQNANKMFAEDLKQSKEELANRVMMEVYQAGGEHGLWSKGQLARNQYSWNNTKPIYAAERTGSSTFVKLVQGLFKGQYKWATDMEEAKAFRQQVANKYGFKSWDMEKTYKFTSSSGIEFELNLNQIMALYAYAKREQAHDHLLKGGFVFGKNTEVVVTKNGIKRTYLNKSAKAHNISDEIMGEIVSKLSEEQKGFVDEMQDYLSTTMGNKGNEVSMRLYGVKLFMEKFYFPLRSAGQFKEKAKEAEMKQQQGQISIANSGFTNAVTPKASNPVVLDGFTDVWASHVNEMSLYHSMVLPMEDFRRVYNYASPNMEGQESASVNSFIENAYGDAATGYFDQLYKELNGGAIVDPRENLSKQMIGKFKKSAVMLSNSVWVQQFSAIGRAYALVDAKYFIGPKVDKQKQSAAWNELKQYAPVAIIKEMGGFDTHTGLSAKDYLLAEEYGKGERIKGLIKDEQYRDEIMGLLPAKADELTWCAIWEAVKRETKAKNSKMDVKSEEFLKKAGERFSEVIEKTQVYDSVLARSAYMRSKNGLMQMITAFMAEPTTTVNMVGDALRKGDKKYIARTFGAVAVSIILNNALASIVYGMRDDDEDETFLEKYAQAFTSGMLDDINPMTYFPVLKDIWSLFQGYDVERSDMAIYSDIADSVKKVVTLIADFDSDMDEDDAAEYYKQVGDALMSMLDAGAAAFGVPLKNVRRDLLSYYNTFKTFASGDSTTWNSFTDALGEAALDGIPVLGWIAGESKTDKLYDAIVSGDTAYVDRLKGSYDSETAYNIAVRKALRENDPRIHEAAVARMRGDLATYTRIAKEIIAEKHFSQDYVVAAINAEINALDKGEATTSKPKASGLYTADDFAVAVAKGDASMANAVKVDIIRTAEKNGKTAEEAEKSFVSSATSACKELFLDGDINVSQAINALVTYCGKTEDGAMADVQYWAFKQDYPDVYVDDQWFDSYYEKVADSGLPIDVYMEYRNAVSTITGDGKKEKRMAVINSLPITSAQKDALYLAEGWAESKLYEAPWH